MIYTVNNFLNVRSESVKGVPQFEPLDPGETADLLHLGNDPVVVSQIAEHLLTAREWVEGETQLSLATRSFILYLDEFPCREIELRLPPLQSITSIVYLDTAGDSQTLSASLYRVDTAGKPARITPAYGQTWPCTYPVIKAITITAVVGYTDPQYVPPCAKSAMRILAKMMFENGGMLCEDGLDSVRRMLDPIRWGGYA